MSEIKIGFFSLQDGTGCTSFANHAANHLVAGENKVALIEPDTVIEKEYSTVKAEFADDGTFYLNEVHYYPAGATTEPEETIEIYDFGKITIFHEFEKDFDKLYLCTDGTGKDIPDIKEYLLESQIQYELIIPGASKDIFNAYKELGNKVISVGGKKETVCPYDLALRLNLILRSKGLVPPEYHKEWEYAPIIFHYVPEEEKSKRGFFGRRKKIKEEPQVKINQEETISEPEPESEEYEGVEVAEDIVKQAANEYKESIFVDVPAPKAPEPKPEPEPEKKPEPPKKTEKPKKEAPPKPKKEPKPPKPPKPKKPPKEKIPLSQRLTPVKNGLNGFANGVGQAMEITSFKLHELKEQQKEKAAKAAEEKALKTAAQQENPKPKKEKKVKTKGAFLGHVSVFVTSFRHGCGSSYTSGSIAVAMADLYKKAVYIDRKDNKASLPDDYMVKEIITEDDRFDAYKNGLIVYDRGLYGELTNLDKSDMVRADLHVMVATHDDLPNIMKFVSEQGEAAYDWLFVFNHVVPNQKSEIIDAMNDFNTLILPFHDFTKIPTSLRKDWYKAIKSCVNSF